MSSIKINQLCFDVLRHELIQAQGCTEPIAIAYAAAKARQVLDCRPERMELRCSGNMVKNAMGVVVPNSGGMRGIDIAAILGAVAGRADMVLKVLSFVTEADIEETRALQAAGWCSCILLEEEEPLYADVTVFAGGRSARVVIRTTHTNITHIEKDGEVLLENSGAQEQSGTFLDKSLLTLENILDFVGQADWRELKEVLEPQVRLNDAIAEEGLAHNYGASVGQTILETESDCPRTRACARAAAASDARMGGCILPVVINSGSGNQGITVSVPVIEYARSLQASEETLYRALAISNLIALHLKSYIGSLSAFCGAVSASCGAGVAITYLLGGGYDEMALTISNTLGNTGGIICDGAKASCAAKIYSSLNAAILAAEMSLRGRAFRPGEGIVADDIETTIRNMGHVGKEGMRSTDSVVLKLMLSRGKT